MNRAARSLQISNTVKIALFSWAIAGGLVGLYAVRCYLDGLLWTLQ
jgi:hypothetical protein